jgi:hypothetical protein
VATALNPGRRHDLGRNRGATVVVWPQYSTNRDTVAFLASVFGLTGENKRNLINVLK